MDTVRRQTRRIYIGDIPVGGGAPVSVQSMTNTDTRDVPATVRQIEELGHRHHVFIPGIRRRDPEVLAEPNLRNREIRESQRQLHRFLAPAFQIFQGVAGPVLIGCRIAFEIKAVFRTGAFVRVCVRASHRNSR